MSNQINLVHDGLQRMLRGADALSTMTHNVLEAIERSRQAQIDRQMMDIAMNDHRMRSEIQAAANRRREEALDGVHH